MMENVIVRGIVFGVIFGCLYAVGRTLTEIVKSNELGGKEGKGRHFTKEPKVTFHYDHFK